ncbi:MAG: ammonium transporter, partial [Anaerolineae bacterium]|nr:ammonium transporter [Anaerolineae bacterium]
MVVLFNLSVFTAVAQEEEPETTETTETAVVEEVPDLAGDIAYLTSNLDTVWMLVAAFLVFWMQAGFALVEAGFVRAKNITNILMKNMFDFVIGTFLFWAVGFGIMFGTGNDFFGTDWFFFSDGIQAEFSEVYSFLTVPVYAFFFFQLVFAATAATIVSGAMAERTEFKGYLVYSAVISAVIYPVVGHMIWGGGFLAQLDTPFHDFAGSTVVHSTGAWCALVGATIIGPRIGRFGKEGTAIPGHNMTIATLGVFILWLGWFGFNPGSQLSADAASIARVTVNTNIGAAAGAFVALMIGWYLTGKAQLPWGLNGALAGLVAITAPCYVIKNPGEAIIVGAIGAAVMYAVVVLMERLEIDDPVGAVAVHGGAGVWGTLAVGIFGDDALAQGILHGGGADQLITQVIGIGIVAAYVIVTAIILFGSLKAIGWLRVSKTGEIVGLDIYEHGMVAYPEFTNSPSEPVL